MPKDDTPGKPTTRRYSPEEKAAAVRMVRTLRAELGIEHGTVHRVARELGYGTESVRSWVRRHSPRSITTDLYSHVTSTALRDAASAMDRARGHRV